MKNFEYLQNETKEHFDIITRYRVNRCNISNCNRKCFYYHDFSDQRRVPLLYPDNKWNYIPKLCGNEHCKKGEKCFYAHSLPEVSYHPLAFKLKLCEFEKKKGYCNKENLCSYAHSEDDRRIKELPNKGFERATYKTLECPLKCNQDSCLYFHDFNERRRDEKKFKYNRFPCDDAFASEPPDASLCNRGDRCKYSHTQNELDYHPENYKNSLYNSTSCPNTHLPNQPRTQEEDHKREENHQKHEVEVKKPLNTYKKFESEWQKAEEIKKHEAKLSPQTNPNRIIDPVKEVDFHQGFNEKDSNPGQDLSDTETILEPILNRELHLDQEENQNNRKFKCKKCLKNSSTYVLGCGKPVCFQCISGPCECGVAHLTKLD